MSLFEFLTDPVLRGPTWGTLFMCIASSLMGAVLMLKRRCLLGESLSHASYPGIVVGVSLFALLFPEYGESAFFGVLGGAFATSYLGFRAIDWMEKKGKVRSDAALAFVLALFLESERWPRAPCNRFFLLGAIRYRRLCSAKPRQCPTSTLFFMQL